MHKLIIIGGGCAGLSAAVYAARADIKPLVFTGSEDKGGLLMKTSIVENYPGYHDGILGFDLMINMESQAVKFGAEIIERIITKIEKLDNHFILTDNTNQQYEALAVIVATGSKPNKLYLEKENDLWSKGISSCAVCDGALYKNKSIVVVGGGDSAMEEALFLTKFSKVTLIHRRDTFRASKIMVDRVLKNERITIIYDTEVVKLYGDEKLTAIDYKNVKTGEITNLNVDGLFYGLGLKPNTEAFKGFIELDEDNYILKSHVSEHNEYETSTSVKGVFVAGDVCDKVYKQAIVAAGDGCKAALDVLNYLQK